MKKSMLRLNTCILGFMFMSMAAIAQMDVYQFSSSKDQELYQTLIKELRCLVCQNQNLEDSNSGLAQDLRKKVYEMIQQGQSRQQISDYMVARYGDFVLYRPAVNRSTAVLWFAPFLLLLVLIVFAIVFIRNKKQKNSSDTIEYSGDQLNKARSLLDEESK